MATIEHKKSKMDGGGDKVANLAVACLHCNQHRGWQKAQSKLLAKQGTQASLQVPGGLGQNGTP